MPVAIAEDGFRQIHSLRRANGDRGRGFTLCGLPTDKLSRFAFEQITCRACRDAIEGTRTADEGDGTI